MINNTGVVNGSTAQIYGVAIFPKETTATVKIRPKLLVEVKAETYYGFRTMAKNVKTLDQ